MRRVVWGIVAGVLTACAPVAAGGPGGGRGGPGGPGPEPTRPQYLNPGTLATIEGFTSAVRIGSTVYISGQVALDDQGRVVGPEDLQAQARQAFANLTHVLQIAGATPEDVTKLTIYVVNLKPGEFDAIRQAAPAFFPQRNPPAGVIVGIQSLPKQGLLIAVDATAIIRAMFRPRR
ncbi:MAG: RidA family protein [Gemmatimonadetes bacterium]|nr:RidA family protein [Gemmatimonadota bacterium]